MTLNASGPISLAGATAGQSIAVELGQSATGTISLNDTAVRTLAGVPSGAIIMPTNFWGKSNASYFIGALYSTLSGRNTEVGNGVAVDSSLNMYVTGRMVDSSSYTQGCLITKYNSTGTIQWQRELENASSGAEEYYKVAVASSGAIYVVGNDVNTSTGTYQGLVVKYDSSGNVTWQRGYETGADETFYDIAIDSSENLYVVGESTSVGIRGLVVLKLNSSGAIQWQKTIYDSSLTLQVLGRGVAVDSSGNVYVTAGTTGGTAQTGIIAKYNNAGTFQWLKEFYSSDNTFGRACACDSSGNVYVVGYGPWTTLGYSGQCVVLKFDSSGTTLLNRVLIDSVGTDSRIGTGVVIYSGSIYVSLYGRTAESGSQDAMWAKLDATTGTHTLSRYIESDSTGHYDDAANAIATDSSGNIYLAMRNFTSRSSAFTSDMYFARLPSDGSKTGFFTVGGVQGRYSASASIAGQSNSLSISSPAYSTGNWTASANTSTLTASTPTLTSSVATL